jgi:thiamine biosynthesis lipoprotein
VCSYSKKITPKTEKLITQFANDVQSKFDLNIESSFTSKLNSLDENKSLPLTNEEYQILTTAKTAYELSNGKFDPTVYPLVKLWGFAPYKYTLNYTPPTAEQINLALAKVNFNAISVTESGVTKSVESVSLDFGGIVKGFVADGIARILKENGHTDGYVSVGTSSLNLLSVESLGVRHPEDGTQTLFTVNCKGQTDLSVSTSGNYEKFHIGITGEKYCHLIDPQTGYTAKTGVASATLIGIDGALADALTTAICLTEYSPNETESPLNELLTTIKTQFDSAKFFVAIIKDDYKILLTNALENEFTLHDQEFSIINI